MPRVPIFDGVPTANPGVSSPPMMQGGQIAAVPGDPGRALQQMGQDMTALGARVEEHQRQEQAKLSATLAKSSYNQLRAAGEKALTTFRGVKGYNALQGSKGTMDALRKEYERIYQGLTDEDARDAFDSAAQGFLISAQTDIDTHAQREKERFETEESAINQQWMEQDAAESMVKAYQSSVGEQDPQKLGPPPPPISGETYMRAALANANEQADRAGIPIDSAQREAIVKETKGRVNAKVVADLLNAGDFTNAKKHLETSLAKGEMDEKTAVAAAKMIAGKEQDDGDLRLGMAIRDTNQPLWVQQKVLDREFQEGRIDARRHKAALEIIDREAKALDSAKKAAGTELVNSVMQRMLQDPNYGIESLSAQEKMALVEGGQYDPLVEFQKNKRFPSDGQSMSEIEALDKAGMLAQISEEQFAGMFMHRMGPRSWAIAKAIRAKAVGSAGQDQLELLDKDEITFNYMQRFGVEGSENLRFSSRNDSQVYRDFATRIEELWSAKQKGLKRKGTIDEYREFLASTLAASKQVHDAQSPLGVDPDADPSDYGDAWVADPADGRKQLFLRDIPKLDRNIIIEELQRAGKDADWQNIASAWRGMGSPDRSKKEQENKIRLEQAASDRNQIPVIQRDPFGVTTWEQAVRISGMTEADLYREALTGNALLFDKRGMGVSLPSAVKNTKLAEILGRRTEKK